MKKLERRDNVYFKITKSLNEFFSKKEKATKYSIGFGLATAAAMLGGWSDVLPKPILEGNEFFSGLNPIAMVAVLYLSHPQII